MSEESKRVHDLIERISNLVNSDLRVQCHEYGVRPVQLEILAYLARCNRYSDTPQAVAEYLGLTKGTVSQTIKVLESKGLVRRYDDTDDKRLVHLKPTAKGSRLVERMTPSPLLAEGITDMPWSEQKALQQGLRSMLRSIQKANQLRTFAPCHSCRFNRKNDNGYLCRLTGEPLSDTEITLLCREHEYPDVTASK